MHQVNRKKNIVEQLPWTLSKFFKIHWNHSGSLTRQECQEGHFVKWHLGETKSSRKSIAVFESLCSLIVNNRSDEHTLVWPVDDSVVCVFLQAAVAVDQIHHVLGHRHGSHVDGEALKKDEEKRKNKAGENTRTDGMWILVSLQVSTQLPHCYWHHVDLELTCLAPSTSIWTRALPSIWGTYCILLICLKSARKTAWGTKREKGPWASLFRQVESITPTSLLLQPKPEC